MIITQRKKLYRNKKILGIIPARYASTRLPAKPLADICGKSLVQWVYDGSKSSNLIDKVIVATDDDRIISACKAANIECVMTSPDISTGSDRILAAYKSLGENFDYLINIQGDEPLIKGETLDSLIINTIEADAPVGTLISRLDKVEDLNNPNIVKVVINNKSNAMYFSRQAIPFVRDAEASQWLMHNDYHKHIGIYIFKSNALERFCNSEQTQLENAEKLEQLRLLENDINIYCSKTDDFFFSIDTPEDLQFIRDYLNQ